MPRFAYVNGAFVPHSEAAVHVEDRGYQFSDGIYEVCDVSSGKLVDFDRHMDRLDRSLDQLSIPNTITRAVYDILFRELIRRNRICEGLVYLQVTRGVAPRDHPFPVEPIEPAVVITAKKVKRQKVDRQAEEGVAVITVPDIRWGRVDIKTVSLLGNVLAIQAARDAGAYDAWQVDRDGYVTESSRANAWIVDKDGNLVTRHLSHEILSGITRAVIKDLVEKNGRTIIERPFTPEEAKAAREAFQTSASAWVYPVVEIDGQPIGNGHPGTVALELRELYRTHAKSG